MGEENRVIRNPLIGLDYPDPDVIRVRDRYYMASTTMYFFPGCEILQSRDLVHWEHATFVYDTLDGTEGQRLQGGRSIYGQGMWAPSLRYWNGQYYLCFVANDTHRTYLYTAREIGGPWEKHFIEGFYHDSSLLFDEDGSIYIAYAEGSRIRITRLKDDLSGALPGGLNREAVREENSFLGYEGVHFYKIRGKYYLFLIHSLKERWRRVEACFVADSLEEEFRGGDIYNDDLGYCGQGVAQGGVVDTPEGDWYAWLFQDRGASGRMPTLLPVTWQGDFPVIGGQGRIEGDAGGESAFAGIRQMSERELVSDNEPMSETMLTPEHKSISETELAAGTKPGTEVDPVSGAGTVSHGETAMGSCRDALVVGEGAGLLPLVDSDDFRGSSTALTEEERKRRYGCFGLRSIWQFNHEPDRSLWENDREKGIFRIRTGKLCEDLTQAPNTLTQRMSYPACCGTVTVDGRNLKEGDYAGLCALQGCFGMVALTRRDGRLLVVMQSREDTESTSRGEDDFIPQTAGKKERRKEWAAVPAPAARVRLRAEADFTDMRDEVRFSFETEEGFVPIGVTHKLYFKLDHFTGCRFGLFLYATKETGGSADFSDFIYSKKGNPFA